MEHLVLGSYSTRKQALMGTGATRQERLQTIMWLAAQLPTADICVQPLDSANLPTGIVSTISSSDFFQHYLPEADCYDQHIRPGAIKLSEWMGAAGTPLPQEKPDRETGLFLRGFLSILHGEASMAMREGDPDTLRLLVHQAVGMRFFDHFQIGISLAAVRQRKERNYPLAIDFYSRALEIREDDHLFFNIARTYYEMKNIDAAKECLAKALALNPELAVARQFLDFITAPSAS
ncbi:MAG: tetratricopeptide repeat protein [Deltaproteobacteria bacterium]|jgi:tetratricopeptide (TPR) repeat protein|nr:tetratricopeptide repeat protein [Deltaproteobacteria bacterium]